jgi:hypothetical protein
MEIQYDEKDPYYSELPDGFKIATIDDFYYNGDLLMKKAYLIHSMVYENRYWALRTKPLFLERNDFYTFLELGRIYILNI